MFKRCEYEYSDKKKCGYLISDRVAWYSLRMYGFEYCMRHQREIKKRKN